VQSCISETHAVQDTALLSVKGAAELLGMSACWIYRNLANLSCIRLGNRIRFDPVLLREAFADTMQDRKPLKPERKSMEIRYQRGYVFQRGNSRVWYGKFREDVRTPDGFKREQRLIRLGTLQELPTKNAARNKLTELIGAKAPTVMDMTFRELTERWKASEGPTLKDSTFDHYVAALNAYVLPEFGNRRITAIDREQIQKFLAFKAKTYSRSTLRSMRVTLGLTLRWAVDCGWIEKSSCVRVKLPLVTGGRQVQRYVLSAEQIDSIAEKLEEPYATLVVFLASTGLRISEAAAVKWTDIQRDGDKFILQVQRRMYDGNMGKVKSLKSERKLPLDPKLVERLATIGKDQEWLFRSRAGTPINPGNTLKRYIRPLVKSLNIALGGWHDFRHTLTTTLRRNGVHPKVVSDLLGHERVNLAMDVYDRTEIEDFVAPLSLVSHQLVANQLVSSGIKSQLAG
jgi:integrase